MSLYEFSRRELLKSVSSGFELLKAWPQLVKRLVVIQDN